MSFSVSVLGSALLALLLAGYLAQKYGLPPPPPKIAAIDLGTTFSSIGIYQAVTGATDIIADDVGRKSIPSVVAFLPNGTVLVGAKAVEQQEKNPTRTLYDAKRFIGRTISENDVQFEKDRARYPFEIQLNQTGSVYFVVPLEKGAVKTVSPEEVGAIIIDYLRKLAEKQYRTNFKQAVISVPAEFDQLQRNATAGAVEKAGMEVRRIVSEPTAAALAYGLHKKKGVEYIAVVDLGGIFVTIAMAGNNRLGGQDFNDRVQGHLLKLITEQYDKNLTDKEDLQQLRLAVENAKIQLTTFPETHIYLHLQTVGDFHYRLTRDEFELLNEDLFESVVDPIEAALEDADITTADIDEIVLVGGSTRIPRIRKVVGSYFGRAPNYGIDPELAVVTGVTVQAGVIGGGWPLQVSAMEIPSQRRKQHLYTGERRKKLRTKA